MAEDTGRSGKPRVSFLPAVSNHALARMSGRLRRRRLHHWTKRTLDQLADWINPVVRGWMNYYGRFHRSKLFALLRRINTYLMRWAAQKYKRLRTTHKRRRAWWAAIDRDPGLFTHWRWVRAFD
ncbi:MAG TPA: group II intron maturase-specific domain-containing protein [Mycobacterium sp.]|nr:group II intron maturase-specific domain-containing protein [Mycobacterium sp.]